MSGSTINGGDDIDPAIVTAIEENPEDIATLIEHAGLNEHAIAAADDGMESITESTAVSTALAANDEELADALDRLAELEATGDLETLAGAMQGVSLLSDAMDDELVMSLGATASSLGELADVASDPETNHGIRMMANALGEAATSDPEPVGIRGLAGALRDEDIQQGLGFLLAVAQALGSRLTTNQEG